MNHGKTDLGSFEMFALPQLEDLYRTALYMLDNESDAQDLIQESFIKAYNTRYDSQFNSSYRLWLFKIMVGLLIDKHWSSHNQLEWKGGTDGIDPDSVYSRLFDQRLGDNSCQTFLSKITTQDVKRAIKNLPHDCRLVVVLSLLENFSYREITMITGISLETVRSRLYQGRKLMQRNLFAHANADSNYVLSCRQNRK